MSEWYGNEEINPSKPEPELEYVETEAIISLPGEWDLYNAIDARNMIVEQIANHEVRKVVVNLKDTEFIDSSVLTTFIVGLKAAEINGKNFVLRDPQKQILEILKITGLAEKFDIEISEQQDE